jgi:hypothetical protein
LADSVGDISNALEDILALPLIARVARNLKHFL